MVTLITSNHRVTYLIRCTAISRQHNTTCTSSLCNTSSREKRFASEIARAVRDLAITHEIHPQFAPGTLRPSVHAWTKYVQK